MGRDISLAKSGPTWCEYEIEDGYLRCILLVEQDGAEWWATSSAFDDENVEIGSWFIRVSSAEAAMSEADAIITSALSAYDSCQNGPGGRYV